MCVAWRVHVHSDGGHWCTKAVVGEVHGALGYLRAARGHMGGKNLDLLHAEHTELRGPGRRGGRRIISIQYI